MLRRDDRPCASADVRSNTECRKNPASAGGIAPNGFNQNALTRFKFGLAAVVTLLFASIVGCSSSSSEDAGPYLVASMGVADEAILDSLDAPSPKGLAEQLRQAAADWRTVRPPDYLAAEHEAVADELDDRAASIDGLSVDDAEAAARAPLSSFEGWSEAVRRETGRIPFVVHDADMALTFCRHQIVVLNEVNVSDLTSFGIVLLARDHGYRELRWLLGLPGDSVSFGPQGVQVNGGTPNKRLAHTESSVRYDVAPDSYLVASDLQIPSVEFVRLEDILGYGNPPERGCESGEQTLGPG